MAIKPSISSMPSIQLLTALIDAGFSEISVQIAGAELKVSQLISVQANSVLPSNSHPDSATVPDPLERVNVDFEGLGLGEFRVNTLATFVQYQSSVALYADGDFVVVWTDTADYDHQVEIVVNAEGHSLLTWSGADPFVDGNAILAKQYDANGRIQ